MNYKLFTLEEANSLLPQVYAELLILRDLTRTFEEQLRHLRSMKADYSPSPEQASIDEDPFFELEAQLDFMRLEIDTIIGNFDRIGVQLKMLEPALLDFPGIVEGKEVLLCWKEGEDGITHYHGWEEGFAGRKRLP
ncbi:hypothetical protein FHS18_006925 [Paenibacillus phyllosphaerae]|uniref:Cell division protein DivIVA n=1 Tax=Paenibacillus phyllosphaerae TaxID=274593 RepID=A0A7W5B5G4_9BACL|nr:DUF2203 domain-containing protein [Paenibacillus phyllosphaerae]MBB3114765.1 hypothetical protein [Paenibacillus phyllosphaerae]